MRSTLLAAFGLTFLAAAGGCGDSESPAPSARPQANTPALPPFNKVPPPPPGIIPVNYETTLPPAPPAEGTGGEKKPAYSILPAAPSILESAKGSSMFPPVSPTSTSLPPPPMFPSRSIRAEDLPPPPLPK